jgi:glutaredoxin
MSIPLNRHYRERERRYRRRLGPSILPCTCRHCSRMRRFAKDFEKSITVRRLLCDRVSQTDEREEKARHEHN